MVRTLIRRLGIRKRNKLEEVFTPSSSAKLTFVERGEIEKQINKALLIPGMQLIVYGHSGSGKTTITQNILNKKRCKYVITNCILDTTINEILLDAFDKLNPFFTSEKSTKTTSKIASDLKASYLAVDSTIKSELSTEESTKTQRVLPVQLSPQRLAEFLGAAGVVWIIEDFHKVKESERQKLSQILKIFVDASNKYPNVKVIAIGAVGTAREVVNYDIELSNRISEIHVPLMNSSELTGIMNKGEKLLNVDFSHNIHVDVIKYSNSLAAICHHLCFSICYNAEILETQKRKTVLNPELLKAAIVDYLKQNSDSFKEILDRALKPRDGVFDNTKEILQAFCKSGREELTKGEILQYPGNKKTYKASIDEYLKLLTTADYGEILRYDENSGKYSFSNPFFKAYVKMQFSTEDKESNVRQISLRMEDVINILMAAENLKLKVEKRRR